MSAKMPMSSNVIPSKGARSDNSRVKELNNMLINGTLSQATYQRLTSLAPPRDLTLGGKAVAAKKAFKPNLNVVRNKNANVKTSKDMTAPRAKKRAPHAKHERVSTLIQTKGVFSEGAGDVSKSRASSRASGLSWSEECAYLQKPVINKSSSKIQKHDNDKDLNASLQRVLGEDEESTLDDKTDLQFRPIKLLQNNWNTKSHKKFMEIKKEKKRLDSEIEESVENLNEEETTQRLMDLEKNEDMLAAPETLEQFFTRKSAQMFVIQFPDELPCETDETTEKIASKTDKEKEKAPSSEIKRQNLRKYLDQESVDGCVGKLQRYKSGKVKLILGKTMFDLDMGFNSNIPQDLVSIESTEEAATKARIVELGAVKANLIATPDWNFLLQQQ